MLVGLTVTTILGSILALEARAWLPYLGRWLVADTIKRFPHDIEPAVRDRWQREVIADFAAFEDRPLGGLLFALTLRLKGGRELAAEMALTDLSDSSFSQSHSSDSAWNWITRREKRPGSWTPEREAELYCLACRIGTGSVYGDGFGPWAYSVILVDPELRDLPPMEALSALLGRLVKHAEASEDPAINVLVLHFRGWMTAHEEEVGP